MEQILAQKIASEYNIDVTQVVREYWEIVLLKELFFGFDLKDGIYTATPEKALLDLLYLSSLGKAEIPVDEMNFKSLSKKIIFQYAERFPVNVKRKVKELL